MADTEDVRSPIENGRHPLHPGSMGDVLDSKSDIMSIIIHSNVPDSASILGVVRATVNKSQDLLDVLRRVDETSVENMRI